MTGPRILGPADEPQRSGAVVAVRWGDYRRQQIFVSSGANIGTWYCLGGEFGRVEVVSDPRTPLDRLRLRWTQPPGTIPPHPTWSDVLALGPVTLLVPSDADAYRAGWLAGRRDLWQGMEDSVRDDPPSV
jgi:hypothetical protein